MAVIVMAVVVGTGCVRDDLVLCGDVACPVGASCDLENATCVAEGSIGVPADDVELLDVACGTTATSTMLVSNPGSTDIEIAARATPSDLAVAPAQAMIRAGETLELTVSLDAGLTMSPGNVSLGAVIIETPREQLTEIVRYSMSGPLVTASSTVDLGETSAGGTVVRTFTVTNSGTTATELTVGNLDAPFSMPTSGPILIEPNTQRELVVQYEADLVVGNHTEVAQLTFSGTHCQPPPSTLGLTARTSGDAMLVSNTFVDFGPAACGTAEKAVVVKLTSQAPFAQDVTASFLGDAQGLTAQVSGTLPPAPGSVALTITRSALVAPRPIGAFAALLQVTATEVGTAAALTKQIPVSYAVRAPLLVSSVSSILAPADGAAAFQLSNAGNASGMVMIASELDPAVVRIPLHIVPSEFELDAMAAQEVDLLFSHDFKPADVPAEGISLRGEAKGMCSPPARVVIVGAP